ncbi:MAG TPA: hypothetical protein VFV82_13155, partial [Candidatus Binatia bacterium]|nr:hypothetical protein [Candidatus Binatia bacterium]
YTFAQRGACAPKRDSEKAPVARNQAVKKAGRLSARRQEQDLTVPVAIGHIFTIPVEERHSICFSAHQH